MVNAYSVNLTCSLQYGFDIYQRLGFKMQFKIKKCSNNEWAVMPVSGDFAGVVVATCEGICLRGAAVEQGLITGFIESVWGAVLNDDVTGIPAIVRSLGIGRAFRVDAIGAPVRVRGDLIVDEKDGSARKSVSRLVMFRRGVFRPSKEV